MVHEPTTLRVPLTGEYDISRTAELRDAILSDHATEPTVIVDLADVTFLDSSGLRALLETRDVLLDRGARLTIANPSKNIQRLLEITGMTEVFE